MKQRCIECGTEFEQTRTTHKYCSHSCASLVYARTKKGKASSKRVYLRAKAKGTAYYQTQKGKLNNLKRSKTFRLRHADDVREYKRIWAKEHYKTPNKEKQKNDRINHLRLNQRLYRQSIKGGNLASKSSLCESDVSALELDIFQLNQKKEKLIKMLE